MRDPTHIKKVCGTAAHACSILRRRANTISPVGLKDRVLKVMDDYGVDYYVKDLKLANVIDNYDKIGLKWSGPELRDYQKNAFNAIVENEGGVISLPTGAGKCLGKGTPVLMFDGSIKNVEDVAVGDLLMGPDSKPRAVLSLARGVDEMYEVIPTNGESWTCNKDHILSLKSTCDTDSHYKNKVENISIIEYLKKTKTFKHRMKLWRTGVEFNHKDVEIDPYALGAGLGSGAKKDPCTTIGEEEIKSETDEEKRIPFEYLSNDRIVRLEILAGLIDTDGYYDHNEYEIIINRPGLRDDILFIARSLGFRATWSRETGSTKSINFVGNYYRIAISGNVDEIPCRVSGKRAKPRRQKRDVLKTGFSIKPVGTGEYYGFTISGDGLFLLGDFTVTHNTIIMLKLLEHYNLPSLILVNTKDLLSQWEYEIEKNLSGKIPYVFNDKHKTMGDITVGMVQSVSKAIGNGTLKEMDTPVFVVDECFTGDTLISTDRGDLMIEDIVREKMDIRVLTHSGKYMRVVNWIEKETTNDLVNVVYDGGSVKCTRDHKFLTPNGLVRAIDLTCEDEIYQHSPTDMFHRVGVRSIECRDCDGPDKSQTTVYDLTVEEDHTYVANGIVVSNCHHIPADTVF